MSQEKPSFFFKFKPLLALYFDWSLSQSTTAEMCIRIAVLYRHFDNYLRNNLYLLAFGRPTFNSLAINYFFFVPLIPS